MMTPYQSRRLMVLAQELLQMAMDAMQLPVTSALGKVVAARLVKKRGRGRPPGSKNKPKPKIS